MKDEKEAEGVIKDETCDREEKQEAEEKKYSEIRRTVHMNFAQGQIWKNEGEKERMTWSWRRNKKKKKEKKTARSEDLLSEREEREHKRRRN